MRWNGPQGFSVLSHYPGKVSPFLAPFLSVTSEHEDEVIEDGT